MRRVGIAGCAIGVCLSLAGLTQAGEALRPLAFKDLRHEQFTWQAQEGAQVDLKQAGESVVCSMAFSRPHAPVWNADLAVEDWSAQGTMLLDFAPGDAARLVVGLKDLYGTVGVCAVDVNAAGGTVKVPLASMYLQGMMLRYVKSVSFWTVDGAPRTVALKGLAVSADGYRPDWPRSTLVFSDAEGPSARQIFLYSKGWVTVSDEHPSQGRKSFLCQLPKGRWMNLYGQVQHDWRNFKAFAFDVYWAGEADVTMRFIIRDSWIKGTGNGAEAAADVRIKSGANAVSIPLSAFRVQPRWDDPKPQAPPPEGIAWEFIHQIGWQVPDGPPMNTFYLDNIRLEGEGKLPAELADLRKSIPAWGYDRLARVDISGSFDKIDIPAPGDRPSLEVGAARAKITPPVGTPMSSDRKVAGILDDVYIRAAVFKDGDRRALLLVLDTVYFPAIPEVTAGCAKALGVREEDVFYCTTHNHNAGAPYASKEFTQQIIDGAVQAAKEAQAGLQPVRAGVAMSLLGINYNRNLKIAADPGNTHDLLQHRFLEKHMDSQPACQDLGTIVFTDARGRVVATLVSYSAHANTLAALSDYVTADWPGWTNRLIEAKVGGVCLTIPGAFGNTNMREFMVDYSTTIKAGRQVAAAALAAMTDPRLLKGIDMHGSGGIGVYSATGLGSPAPEKTEPEPLVVRALRLGPVIFLDSGGELFVQQNMDTKKRSAFPYTFYAYSRGGYFPTPDVYKPDKYGSRGRKPDWGQVVADTAVKLTRSIKGSPPTQPGSSSTASQP